MFSAYTSTGVATGSKRRGQIFLGSDAFAARMRAPLAANPARARLTDAPRLQRRGSPPPLKHLFNKAGDRDAGIVQAFRAGHTQTAITQACGLSMSRVSRLVARAEAGEDASASDRRSQHVWTSVPSWDLHGQAVKRSSRLRNLLVGQHRRQQREPAHAKGAVHFHVADLGADLQAL